MLLEVPFSGQLKRGHGDAAGSSILKLVSLGRGLKVGLKGHVLEGGRIPRGRPSIRVGVGDDRRGNSIPSSVSGGRLRQACKIGSAESPFLPFWPNGFMRTKKGIVRYHQAALKGRRARLGG